MNELKLKIWFEIAFAELVRQIRPVNLGDEIIAKEWTYIESQFLFAQCLNDLVGVELRFQLTSFFVWFPKHSWLLYRNQLIDLQT